MLTTEEYIMGLICPRALYVHKNSKQPLLEPPAERGYVELARQFLTPNSKEHTFHSPDGCVATLDIVMVQDDKLDLIAVRPTQSIKDIDFYEAVFMYHTVVSAGFKVRSFNLAYFNGAYVRSGELTSDLFILKDVSKQLMFLQAKLKRQLIKLKVVLGFKEAPDVEIGYHCYSPTPCRYNCWQLPENNVFELDMPLKKKLRLYYKDIVGIEDALYAPSVKFNDLEELQAHCIIRNKIGIQEQLKEWIASIGPQAAYFLHIEGAKVAVPPLDGLEPFSVLPEHCYVGFQSFQSGGQIVKDFKPKSINRLREFADQLLDFVEGAPVPIIVYDDSTKHVIKTIVKVLPHYSDRLSSISSRLVKMEKVFSQKLYYDPRCKGNFSLPMVAEVMSAKNDNKALTLMKIFQTLKYSIN